MSEFRPEEAFQHTSEYKQAYEDALNGNGSGDGKETEEKHSDPWPVLADDALYSLAGNLVRAISPYTEADPVAVLVNILVMFGNVIGPNAHFRVEFTKHFLRFFVALVGRTAKGRKGQSFSTPQHTFNQIDPDWVKECITSGLSSGEGLIFQVRDPRYSLKDGEEVLVDKGAADKRLLLVEGELAGALKVATRDGNTLSVIIRQAWDTGDLHPLTKNNPIRATGAHISIIGHITGGELLRHLTETEQINGFANRFLWLLVRRSKVIPRPKGIPQEELEPFVRKLQEAVEFARKVQEMDRDEEAEILWEEVYPELSEGKPGLFGAIIARAEVQVMRLACVYALLDRSAVIQRQHLVAAIALWDYAEESARLIFGDSLGDPVADEISRALRRHPEGLTRTDISYLFGRNRKASEIDRALGVLLAAGQVRREDEQTGGRPTERWFACTKKTKETK
jgi:hypothetical protein